MKIYQGDSLEILKTMPSESVDMVITSPPYYALRDYGVEGQLGLEPTFQEYINKLCDIFDEVKRVLKKSGSCWVNLGDSYGGTGDKNEYKDPKNPDGRNGQKISLTKNVFQKCLLQIPARFAIEMTNRGWILRNKIIWHKPNCMPSSVKDRFTVDFEELFFFVKNKKYYFEQQKEPMKMESLERYKYEFGKGEREKIRREICGSPTGFRKQGIVNKQDQVGRSDYTGFNARYKPNADLMRNIRCVWSITTKGFK
jgi:DNA modification methylase